MSSISHQLIFISAKRKHDNLYDLSIWSASSEMLLLLQAEAVDSISTRLEQCLRKVKQSIVVILAVDIPEDT